ncbi:MAG: hypothetical protein HY231_05655 [Acidobacteria bacterium]|nr:hypothetical protein [Acidobacteriota bacterium]
MQTKDDLTEEFAARYAAIDDDAPKAYPASKRMLAVVAAMLVPGAGHLVLGKYGRGLLFFATLTGAFILGLSLHARLFYPLPSPTEHSSAPDFVGVLWFFAQIGSGFCYLVSYLLGLGTVPQPSAATYEYGNTFTCLAGLLNYLLMYDVYDIAAGRKR